MKLKLISDGTNTGTKLINEETGETVQRISKLSFEANAKDQLTKVTVELFDVPVEIVSKAKVDLYEFIPPFNDEEHTKTFFKNIKIASEGRSCQTIISDAESGEAVGAIQKIVWEATPQKRSAKIDKIKFDKTDWTSRDKEDI